MIIVFPLVKLHYVKKSKYDIKQIIKYKNYYLAKWYTGVYYKISIMLNMFLFGES